MAYVLMLMYTGLYILVYVHMCMFIINVQPDTFVVQVTKAYERFIRSYEYIADILALWER